MSDAARPPRVFISYSHDSPEHMDRVLALADRLRALGVDAWLDQYEEGPAEGWPLWTERQVQVADFVLIVVTPTYRRRFEGMESAGRASGISWEGAVLKHELYRNSRDKKLIPVVLSAEDMSSIPGVLRSFTYYDLSPGTGFESLYRRLTNRIKVGAPELGPRRPLPVSPRRSIDVLPDVWQVPHDRNLHFVNREELLQRLAEVCAQGRDEKVHVLVGLGGIGKTAALVELLYRIRSSFRTVLWFDSSSSESLQRSFVAAARALGLEHAEEATGEAVLSRLRRTDGWIVVFDDLREVAWVEAFRARLGGRGLLFASAREAPAGSFFEIHPVGSLSEADSLSLLSSWGEPRTTAERHAAVEIARRLDGSPLAITLAAATVHQEGMSFAEYLDFLGETETGRPYQALSGDLPAGNIFEELDRLPDFALGLLQAASCFAADAATPLTLLAEAIEALPDTELTRAVEHLAARGLVELDDKSGRLRIHPLVARYLLQHRPNPAIAVSAEEALRQAAARATASGRTDEGLIPHLRAVVDRDGIRHDLRFSRLALELGAQLRLAGQPREADGYLGRALEIRESKGRLDAETAHLLSLLAEAAEERGDRQEAISYARRANQLMAALQGDDHPETLSSADRLRHLEEGQAAAAEELCELVPWGKEMLSRLREDSIEVTETTAVRTGRWLLRLKLPRALQEAYATAPEVLLLAVQGEAQGGDLRRAQEELERHRFELDLDLLVVTDERPDLPGRIELMYQTEGQWVPWSREGDSFPPLAEAFRRFLPMQDVFEQRDAVRGRQMIGRSGAINDLVHSILRGQASGLFGLRKVGKTSVTRAVTDKLDPVSALLSLPRGSREGIDPLRSSLRAVWLDAGRFHERTLEAFADRLLRALDERLEAEGIHPARSESSGLGALDRRLDEVLSSSSQPVLFVLDEYDLLFEGSSGQPAIPGIERLFQVLRGHAQESGRLVLLLIGRDPSFLEAPEMGGQTNPMLGWLVPRWLGPMEPADADLLMTRLGRRVGLEMGSETLQLARHWTGGHPRLEREFGSALLEVVRRDGVLTASGAAPSEASHLGTDPYREMALDRFLDRQEVLTIGREISHLLSTRYPEAFALLEGLVATDPADRGPYLGRHGGWHRPGNRILRNFGLIQGHREQPELPAFLVWYLQTFEEPVLRRQA